MPRLHRIGADSHDLAHRFGWPSEVQYPNGDGPLSDFWTHRTVDDLLDFRKLFIVMLEVFSSAHPKQFSSLVDDFRLLVGSCTRSA